VRFILKLIPGGNQARLVLGVVVLVGIAWVVHAVQGFFHRYNSASFSTGTVDLALSTQGGSQDQLTAMSLSGMQPGADVYLGLSVVNTGSAGFRYNMIATPSGDGSLGKDLKIGVAAVPDSGCGASAYAAGTPLLRDVAGLSSASFTGRSLAASTTDYLCFHVELPSGFPSSLQGKSAQATLDFTAQQ
jgi:hypothetical protein